MSYRLATFNLYGQLWEMVRAYTTAFDLTRYRAGLQSIIDEISSIFRKTFNVDVVAVYPQEIKSIIDQYTADIPETSVPWWVKEKYWCDLQSAFYRPLTENNNAIIISRADDPYIPGLRVEALNISLNFERSRTIEVANRGSFNVDVLAPNISETISVPNNQYFERIYQNFIVDLDSLIDAARDSIQWLAKGLLWARLPTVTLQNVLQNFQFTQSWNGVDPLHVNLVNTGGWLTGAYGAEITLSVPESGTNVTFIFRDINNYTNELSRARVTLDQGTHTLLLRGSGFLSPLPSVEMSLYPSKTMKVESIRLLTLWEVLATLFRFW
jgi:hypothetical protein